jgi:hypothetical protein
MEATQVSQHSERGTFPAAVERADQFWGDVGQSLKMMAQRLRPQNRQSTTVEQQPEHAPEPTEQVEQPTAAHPNEPEQPPMEQSKPVVQRLRQRLGQTTSATGALVQRAGARLRQSIEDLVADARSLRQHKTSPS